jgi:hypothetical protein
MSPNTYTTKNVENFTGQSEEYLHVPTKNKLVLEKDLPTSYILTRGEEQVGHIAEKKNISRSWSDSRILVEKRPVFNLCGESSMETASNVRKELMCEDCLKIMNDYLDFYLYDEENEEFYHPVLNY